MACGRAERWPLALVVFILVGCGQGDEDAPSRPPATIASKSVEGRGQSATVKGRAPGDAPIVLVVRAPAGSSVDVEWSMRCGQNVTAGHDLVETTEAKPSRTLTLRKPSPSAIDCDVQATGTLRTGDALVLTLRG